jgi:biotin carboxylase
MTHLLLVGAWPELAGELVGLPARVSLFQLPGTKSGEGHVYRFSEQDYQRIEDTVSAAAEIHARDPIDVVAGFREYALPTVAAIAQKLGIRSVPAPATQDKAGVRKLLNAGAPRPVPYELCATVAQVRDFAGRVGLPVLIKPPVGGGSIGVHAVLRWDDIPAAFAHAAAASGAEVLVEQLVTGPEYGVETRSLGGRHEILGMTEKITDGPPHFVEYQHLFPARLSASNHELLCAETTRALTAIGHDTGPSHVEVILSPDGPAIVEVNRRMAGDRIFELIPLATGRNIMRESLLDALGVAHHPAPTADRAACIRFLSTDRPRQLPDPLPAAPSSDTPHVIRTHITAEAGKAVGQPTSSLDRFAYVMTLASTADAAATAAETAADRLMNQLFGT